jgi:hypothetical protein
MPRVTDDPAVVVERDTPVVAVELGAEERQARGASDGTACRSVT